MVRIVLLVGSELQCHRQSLSAYARASWETFWVTKPALVSLMRSYGAKMLSSSRFAEHR
jgi:hypothetical protein